MKEPIESEYIKRTQKDYSYTFKLQVVQEYESGNISKGELRRKYGIQGDATIRKCIPIWHREICIINLHIPHDISNILPIRNRILSYNIIFTLMIILSKIYLVLGE
jgi:hypothetical protein